LRIRSKSIPAFALCWLAAAAADTDISSRRLTRDPGNEARDLRMRSQRFDGAICLRELGLAKQVVDLVVTGTAEKNDSETFIAREIATCSPASVNGARNKMVPCQVGDGSLAEGTTSLLHGSNLRAHEA
jgi:hypothetical protein